MKLTCQCCGFTQDFADAEAAFQAGWDAPPHFTGYVCCNLCPAVCVVFGMHHEIAHYRWQLEGRPKEFGPNDRPDENLGEDWKKMLAEAKALVEKFKKLVQ